jgi:hypothetical protein
MFRSSHLRCLTAALLPLLGCAGVEWPDQPGTPVPLSRADNVEASDTFLKVVTERRQADGLSQPIVIVKLQSQMAEAILAVQDGRLSPQDAIRNTDMWGATILGGDVDTWLIDCSSGSKMKVPRALLKTETLSLTFSAGYVRLPGATENMCAVLVMAPGPGYGTPKDGF